MAAGLVPDLPQLGLHGVEGVGADDHGQRPPIPVHRGYLLLEAAHTGVDNQWSDKTIRSDKNKIILYSSPEGNDSIAQSNKNAIKLTV